jgi:hypothetical protein
MVDFLLWIDLPRGPARLVTHSSAHVLGNLHVISGDLVFLRGFFVLVIVLEDEPTNNEKPVLPRWIFLMRIEASRFNLSHRGRERGRVRVRNLRNKIREYLLSPSPTPLPKFCL